MDEPLTFCYADPPYIGQARKHYKHDPQCAEVDHAELIRHLELEYPAGWALSCSSSSLQTILAMCPASVRIGAWVKPWASFKPGIKVAYTWEPVVFHGGRKRGREGPTVKDHVIASVELKKGLAGAKPRAFCYWLFELLGMMPGDTLVDMFPGTGAVTRFWQEWASPFETMPLFAGGME